MTEQVREPAPDARRGSQALKDSLKLQEAAQKRAVSAATGRGRRRKGGEVIDLDQLTVVRSRRRRIFMTLLVVEALVAVVAIAVFVLYLASGDVS